MEQAGNMEHRCCGSWETNGTNLMVSCYEPYTACPMTAVRMAEGGKMQKRAKWTNEEIQLALFQVTSSTMGLREASRAYGVPVSTLKRHLDKQNKFAIGKRQLGRPTIFTTEMEDEFAHHILQMESMCFGYTRKSCMQLAYEFAERNGLQHPFN
ncbi:hypothetical protein BaRGS_00010935 [Batillaria attramentaria]